MSITVTKTSHPTIFEAFETISHDRGSRAGHKSYAVPGEWDDVEAIEDQLAALTPDELEDFCIGAVDSDAALLRSATFPRGDALLNAFFEEGGCPVCDRDAP